MGQLRGFEAVRAAASDAFKCVTCGKSTIVLNTAGYRRPFRGQSVTGDTHCACPGGPAAPSSTPNQEGLPHA